MLALGERCRDVSYHHTFTCRSAPEPLGFVSRVALFVNVPYVTRRVTCGP